MDGVTHTILPVISESAQEKAADTDGVDEKVVTGSGITDVITETDTTESTGDVVWNEKLKNVEPGWSWDDIKDPKVAGSAKSLGSNIGDRVALEVEFTDSITEKEIDSGTNSLYKAWDTVPSDGEDIIGSGSDEKKFIMKGGLPHGRDSNKSMFEVGSNASVYEFGKASQNEISDIDEDAGKSTITKLVSDAEFATWRKRKAVVDEAAIRSGYDVDHGIVSLWSKPKEAGTTGFVIDTVNNTGEISLFSINTL